MRSCARFVSWNSSTMTYSNRSAQRRAGLGVALPQPHRLDDQIVEVERRARAQRLLILRIDLCVIAS